MTATNHYRDQIGRAMDRLAQLQAKELLANQRREAKEQQTAKREEMKRRQRVADLVFLAGAQTLDDAERACAEFCVTVVWVTAEEVAPRTGS
ncbi:hypothetical protein AB8Z76_22160 [Xanthomonas phaseoli pv. phaseoli]|uniref:hypothetical protein n=1 Tax=Xanthomonas TaxID=338 RepID=UPI001F32831E|nr:hypothetical protein [Xanthomonas phaseoli]UZB16364.1 hypothetical protein OM949_20990 [Xanthomonas phaseoli pv. phaseoli]UZB20515.1 hypothetical protein OM947_21100 [Xanthomonas phaseoli pv. phaseoli]